MSNSDQTEHSPIHRTVPVNNSINVILLVAHPSPSFSRTSFQCSFGKSNVAYITWIVAGILIAEGITGGLTDILWSAANRGRTYESVDWTTFIVEDDDDDDDEDEDEDEDEEGDDDDDDDDE